MKKIFTLVFSLGLLTSAFAQSPNRRQNQSPGSTHQSSSYAGNNHDSRNGSNLYSNNKNPQWNNKDSRDRHEQYAYSNNDRGRDDGDRYKQYAPKYEIGRSGHDYDQHYRMVQVPLFQVILGIGRR
ncbi:MAG: hypothetical protein ABI472_12900 [Ginsengibacter sp.]